MEPRLRKFNQSRKYPKVGDLVYYEGLYYTTIEIVSESSEKIFQTIEICLKDENGEAVSKFQRLDWLCGGFPKNSLLPKIISKNSWLISGRKDEMQKK